MKRFTKFFTIADFIEEEQWLREQHKKGLKLTKFVLPCFYTFEEVEPEDVIYRLDYKNSKASAEYKQMYLDYGWEYFGSCVGWNYFRKKACDVSQENDGELFSDKESKIDMLEKIIKTRLLPLIAILLCCIVPNLSRFFNSNSSWIDIVLGCVFYVLFFIYILLIAHCGRKLKKLKSL